MTPDDLKQRLTGDIASAADLAALEAVRVAAIGKSGSITALLKTLGAMDAETRAKEGPKIHGLRESVAAALAGRKAELEDAELDRRLKTEHIDLSLPARETPKGSVHPVSQVMDELAEIFADLGFTVGEGPEIEDQWYNFTALNMPEAHPARAMHDTFTCGGMTRQWCSTHTRRSIGRYERKRRSGYRAGRSTARTRCHPHPMFHRSRVW